MKHSLVDMPRERC